MKALITKVRQTSTEFLPSIGIATLLWASIQLTFTPQIGWWVIPQMLGIYCVYCAVVISFATIYHTIAKDKTNATND